jgi:hypothetical protein
LIIAKTKKRVGPDYEDEEDENAVQDDERKWLGIWEYL